VLKDCGGIDCAAKDDGGGYAPRFDVPGIPGGADCITADWGSMGEDVSDLHLQPATLQRYRK